MGSQVLTLAEIDRTHVAVAGGKGAQLGELTRIDGVSVPDGFCVTTDAFRRAMAEAPLPALLDRLSRLSPDDAGSVRTLSAEVRQVIEGSAFPDALTATIADAVARLDASAAYAVRSSATAEDLPGASFAGQHDTYLNVVGTEAVLEHIRRCWASLFSDRAVSYRMRNGHHHGAAEMAVVVQRMLFPEAAGTMFTADAVTSNRKVVCVEAGFGLGEGVVSALVEADAYKVRDGEVVARTVAVKRRAVVASPAGGTETKRIAVPRQTQAALTDAQAVALASLGRRIEAHFGSPQDIEWCLLDDSFHVVQSRPITTLFPLPEAAGDGLRVYVSVGHGQMMTDAMKPLGISMWQLTALPPMHEAGGRLFVDVTARLASAATRASLLEVMGRGDPLMRDALQTVLERSDLAVAPPEDAASPAPALPDPPAIEPDPGIVTELMSRTQASIATLRRGIATVSGAELFDFILADIQELRRILFDPRSHRVFMSAMEATWWLNERMEAWLGETNAADVLTQSVAHNVTSEMGLALLDLADVIRAHPAALALLERAQDDSFLDELSGVPGGRESRDAVLAYLKTYGMRCVGEIDITRPRWSEHPVALVPAILGNIRNFEPGEAKRRFKRGERQALAKQQALLERVRALPDGEHKAVEVKQMIDRVRAFIGYREYPKYGMVSRYLVYKQALLAEADRLVHAGALRGREDIFYLTFQELHDAVRAQRVDQQLIDVRKESFRAHQALTPPRVLTSDGETASGTYRRDRAPAGALLGLGVSAGIVEGRARVILEMSDADLEPGDILVTAYTDPSWSPLFVAISGMVTEVGGAMTHGAVVAREYGLPAVVAVQHATRLIRDGQRIRIDGSAGHVEILS